MATTDAPDIGSLESLDRRGREAVETLLFRLADDELVLADRYTYWQVRAPTLESDIALANIAQDELGHARLWYDLLESFGYDEMDLIWERDPADFRHATLAELPWEPGDWADPIVRGYLYDVAEELRLDAIEDSSVAPVRDRVAKVRDEEEYHLEHATNWLERLVDDEEAHQRVQSAVDRLVPYGLTLFEPASDAEAAGALEDLGVRTDSLVEMRDAWLTIIEDTLADLGLSVPAVDLPQGEDAGGRSGALPDHVGRDGDHTEHWDDLHAEMTYTYEHLERDYVTEIMTDE